MEYLGIVILVAISVVTIFLCENNSDAIEKDINTQNDYETSESQTGDFTGSIGKVSSKEQKKKTLINHEKPNEAVREVKSEGIINDSFRSTYGMSGYDHPALREFENPTSTISQKIDRALREGKYEEQICGSSRSTHNGYGKLKELDPPTLTLSQKLNKAIREGKNVSITYSNYNGEFSSRVLSNIRYSNEFNGYRNQHIRAFCHNRHEMRTFKIDRIISLEIL